MKNKRIPVAWAYVCALFFTGIGIKGIVSADPR